MRRLATYAFIAVVLSVSACATTQEGTEPDSRWDPITEEDLREFLTLTQALNELRPNWLNHAQKYKASVREPSLFYLTDTRRFSDDPDSILALDIRRVREISYWENPRMIYVRLKR